jgi:SOS-response transcriptional repressor LexA
MARPPKALRPLTHEQLWTALDRLAERGIVGLGTGEESRARSDHLQQVQAHHRRRPPALAFERIDRPGARRHLHFDRQLCAVDRRAQTRGAIDSAVGFAQAASGAALDERGFPAAKGRDEIALPFADDEHAYALEISGDAMRPAYRDGDIIVVAPATPIRRGDRVVVKTTGGEVMIGELKRRTARTLELQPLDSKSAERTLAASDVAWVARIVWVKL